MFAILQRLAGYEISLESGGRSLLLRDEKGKKKYN